MNDLLEKDFFFLEHVAHLITVLDHQVDEVVELPQNLIFFLGLNASIPGIRILLQAEVPPAGNKLQNVRVACSLGSHFLGNPEGGFNAEMVLVAGEGWLHECGDKVMDADGGVEDLENFLLQFLILEFHHPFVLIHHFFQIKLINPDRHAVLHHKIILHGFI